MEESQRKLVDAIARHVEKSDKMPEVALKDAMHDIYDTARIEDAEKAYESVESNVVAEHLKRCAEMDKVDSFKVSSGHYKIEVKPRTSADLVVDEIEDKVKQELEERGVL